ncbi:MAG: glycosyltransferase family 39 protein [Gammaproteobacteria bacterium]|nr:glycosyltransferase family 39 protein [Gammaproteobacteria bacterium]
MSSIPLKSLDSLAATLLLALHVLALSWFALNHPIYTWDVVPYVATTFAAETEDPAAVHEATYGLLRQSLDAAQFNALISGEYAAAMYSSPENFATQLSMYEIKPLYVLVLGGLAAVGVNPVQGIIWLSLIPGLLICVILFLWLRNLTGPMQAALVVILFSICARLFDLSRIPTPDNLSALMVLAGVYLLLARGWVAAAVICLGLSIWVRSNNILFVAPLLALLCWNHWRRGEPLRSADLYWYSGGLSFGVFSYFSISAVYDYDWWRLFYHTLVQPIVDIEEFSIHFSWNKYLQILSNAALDLVTLDQVLQWLSSNALLFLLLWVMTANWDILARILCPKQQVSISEAALLCMLVIMATILLFPLISGLDRLLCASYAIITVSAVDPHSDPLGTES